MSIQLPTSPAESPRRHHLRARKVPVVIPRQQSMQGTSYMDSTSSHQCCLLPAHEIKRRWRSHQIARQAMIQRESWCGWLIRRSRCTLGIYHLRK